MSYDIEHIFSLIDCNQEIKKQEAGIKAAREIDEIVSFILPMHPSYNKNVWENCAKILSYKTDSELLPYLPELLEWLQDLNWPGAFIIIERLILFDGVLLLNPYVKAIEKAKKYSKDDQQWYDHLTILINNKSLSKKMDKILLDELSNRCEEFWH